MNLILGEFFLLIIQDYIFVSDTKFHHRYTLAKIILSFHWAKCLTSFPVFLLFSYVLIWFATKKSHKFISLFKHGQTRRDALE